MRRHLLILLALLLLVSCKPPRNPRAGVESKATGQWHAQSAHGSWLLSIEEELAGKLRGTGSIVSGNNERTFALEGLRDQSVVKLEFTLGNTDVRFLGSVMDSKTMVGELFMSKDTLPLSFTRD